ncbi:MAG TPA: hypothetical protein VH744_10895 [Terriglobales bacterium]
MATIAAALFRLWRSRGEFIHFRRQRSRTGTDYAMAVASALNQRTEAISLRWKIALV